MTSPRTYLYVPGHRPERFDKAADSGTDAVIIDLEDAVPVAAKAEARAAAVALVAHRPAYVRINQGERGQEDLEALAGAPCLAGVVVPKAAAAVVGAVAARLPGTPLVALVESAVGVEEAGLIAAAPGVVRLAVGEVDLAADLRLGADPLPDVLWAIRARVVVAAAAADLATPIGPVCVDLTDGDALAASTAVLRRAGFWARQVIHPSQVAIVHEALRPSARELDEARGLLDGAAAADGGVFVDANGRMVDEAVLRSARLLLSLDR